MKLMEVMTELMNMYQEQNEYQAQAQSKIAQAAAAFTEASAWDQAQQTVCQGATELASAGMSFVQAGLTTKYSASSQDSLKTAGNNEAALNKFETMYKTAQPAQAEAGMGTTPAARAADETLVANRINDLNSGQKSLLEAARDGANDTTSTGKNVTEAALAQMKAKNSEAFDQLSQNLNKAQEGVSRDINNAHIGLQTAQTKAQMWTTAANSTIGAGMSAGQAYFQKDAGVQQGNASMAQSSAQIAATMASNSRELIGQFYQEEIQALQMLQQLAATVRV
jgi:hypothetical protein